MDRQKIITTIVVVSGIIGLWGWFDRKHSEFIGEAFVQSYDVNSFIVKDSKTEKKVLTLTDSEPDFSQMAQIYDAGYANLDWSERKLLKNDPVYEVEFLLNDEVLFTMGIYKVEKDRISLIPHDDEEVRTISYSPNGKDTYIFGRKIFYNYHLLFVHEGLKELLNRILEADSK